MRDKKWRQKTTYSEREADWRPHNMIIDELTKYSKISRATEDEDRAGIDFYIENLPFDIKITDDIPFTYEKTILGYPLFKWLLENQDLDRFHPTNRIIILLAKYKKDLTKEDASKIAAYIEKANVNEYYKNIEYTLRGRRGQKNHEQYNKQYSMEKGLLILYVENTCVTYPYEKLEEAS